MSSGHHLWIKNTAPILRVPFIEYIYPKIMENFGKYWLFYGLKKWYFYFLNWLFKYFVARSQWWPRGHVQWFEKDWVFLGGAAGQAASPRRGPRQDWVLPLGGGVPGKMLCESFHGINLHFQEKFNMTKSEFQACPRWKQIDMRKQTGLFWNVFCWRLLSLSSTFSYV